MVQFITNAPLHELREVAPFVGVGIEIEPADSTAPTWATAVVRGNAGQAMTRFMLWIAESQHKIDSWRPRPIHADPTFVFAMQSIDRNGSSSAPAATYAR